MTIDQSVRRGNTGWIMVALDLTYWAMHSAPYRRIHIVIEMMAIQMASKAAIFFSVADYLLFNITVAK